MATVIVAFAETLPARAVIVVVPAPTAVALPAPSTVATPLLDDDQETLAATVLPAEFAAVALNVCVAPIPRLAEDGETDRVATAVESVPDPVPVPLVPVPVPVIDPNSPTLVSPQPASVTASAANVAIMTAGRDLTIGIRIEDCPVW